MKTPKGFRFSGVAAGLKPSRRDLALIVSDVPCAAAGAFTVNKAKAAPVTDCEGRLPAEGVRAIVANSGNANALTGPAGVEDVGTVRGAIAAALGIQKRAVLTASTGVIGVRLPVHKIAAAAPALAESLGPHPELAAEAIMTTDTRPKMASRELELSGKAVTLTAICKGSGMIAPQMATMLCFVATDAALTPKALDAVLKRAVDRSFNNLTVDGDMSTNDTVIALANGLAGNPRLGDPCADLDAFEAALTDLCAELAQAIAADGEGATKMLEVVVSGAPTAPIARDLAKSIAQSSLVKAALFGADPNWGRVLATVGARAGSQCYPVDPALSRVTIQGLTVFGDGAPVAHDAETLRQKMRGQRVDVLVALAQGEHAATAWGCDLSYDYVKINADYTSLIVKKDDGAVAKDDRVTNYSPAFKRSLLVEALKYISAFTGQIAVLKYGGASMVKQSLKEAFAEDVQLLKRVGLRPVVVHGGAPEITRTLEKMGCRSEFVDGLRITGAADLPVVEMVLTGKVNQELVSLLNARGAGAVGLSGKDGSLLKARKRLHESGRDLGSVGEVVSVNADFLRMFLDKDYVPVISPIGIAEDGAGLSINADDVAAAVAVALQAKKLIYLADAPGLLETAGGEELVAQVKAGDLAARVERSAVTGGMKHKALAALAALSGGVERVHLLDGRSPHMIIAELFTDKGVGTLVTAD